MVNVNLFSQILSLVPRDKFHKIAVKHKVDKHSKGITPWSHFVAMLFCQFSGADSLRSITGGLLSSQGNLSHLGVEQSPSRSNLSYLNAKRDYRFFKDLYFMLWQQLSSEHTFVRKKLLKLKRPVYLIDATVIPLCLELFDWAKYRTKKGAAKIHMVLDYDGCLPVFADLTQGKTHEITIARTKAFPPGSLLVFDMGYIDYKWMNHLDSTGKYFVTRAKDNMAYSIMSDNPIPDSKADRIKADRRITLFGDQAEKNYPNDLRLVSYWDSTTNREFNFLTNNHSWSAQTVADCYKERWNIESFFKQLKQELNVKSFVGTSENAVQIQLWTALITILLLKYMQARCKHQWNLSNMVSFIRLHLFVKTALWEWLNQPFFKAKRKNTGYQLELRMSSG